MAQDNRLDPTHPRHRELLLACCSAPTDPYSFHPYDVLQIETNGKWEDFSTLRDGDDLRLALRYVQEKGFADWKGKEFRIRRGLNTVVLSRKEG